jgi:hypothetical protein
MANADYKVRFHDTITIVIPSLFQLLEDKEGVFRWCTVEVIGNLAVHRESQSGTTVA